jgi:uncharacterized RDD family membrane protein YckC
MIEQQLSSVEASGEKSEQVDLWRNEVQDRLERYKRRRGRRIEGAYTMRFPFPVDDVAEPEVETEPPPTEVPYAQELVAEAVTPTDEGFGCDALPGPGVRVAAELVEQLIAEMPALGPETILENVDLVPDPTPTPTPEAEPEPFVDTVSRPRPKRKVIAFPRQLSVAPEMVYRLADPVTEEVPRILDVPEELEATPFLDGLQLGLPNAADVATDHEHVELPFRAVAISRRAMAGLTDFAVVGAGVAIFAAAAYKTLADPPITKPLVLGIVAAIPLLWGVYQHLLTVYAGKTLGMLAVRLRLRTFKGNTPTLRQRRNRVLGFYLSTLSLGMGLMWAFVDVDALCWHDRLSHTYLCERE